MRISQHDIIEKGINDPHKPSPDKNGSQKENILNTIRNRNANSEERSLALREYIRLERTNALPIVSEIIEDTTENISFREDAIYQLSWIEAPEEGVSLYLLSLLENKELTIRNLALGSLAGIGSKDGLPLVINAIIESKDSWQRSNLAYNLRERSKIEWKDRIKKVIESLKLSKIKPEEIDESAIIDAIRISDYHKPKSQDSVVDYLIVSALDQSSRMTGILAKLIVEICSGSQAVAGQKIQDYEKANSIPSDKLKSLRIAIGGEIALDPFLNILKNNLDENFQKPINALNEDTRQMWQKTIRYAQYGFTTRMVMSVIVFLVGIILLVVSSWQILFGHLHGEQIYGVGVSFVTGLGMMLTVVYRGPLREIRKSVNDLGISSAAFIAYVHRVLEISHTFSFYYLNQKISFDEMTNSSKLIDEAMNSTVFLLSSEEADSKRTNTKEG